MHRPTISAVLWLSARTALRRVGNSMALAGEKLEKQSAAKKAAKQGHSAPRTGTLRRGAKSSLWKRLLGWAFGFSLLLGYSLFAVFLVNALVAAVRIDEAKLAEKMPVARERYEALRSALDTVDAEARRSQIEETAGRLIDSTAERAVVNARNTTKRLIDLKGLAGFEPVDADGRWSGDWAYLSDAGRARAFKAIGLALALLNVCLALCLFAMTGAAIKGADPEMAWLFQFPVPRWVLFLCRLIHHTLDNVGTFVTTSLIAGTVLASCGYAHLACIGIAGLLGLTAIVGIGAFRLVGESLLTQKCSRRTRGAVSAMCSTLGAVGLALVFYSTSADLPMYLAINAADALPRVAMWNPLSLGLGAVSSEQGLASPWWLIVPAQTLLLSVAAIVVTARLFARGFEPAADTLRQVAATGVTATGKRRWFTGLVGKELLQIVRKRELLLQILLAPIPLVFILYVKNPDTAWETLTGSAGQMCTTLFAIFAYTLLLTATALLGAELKTIWFLQTLPRSLADSLRAKARTWAGVLAVFAIVMLAAVIPFAQVDYLGLLLRLPFLFLYLWLFAEITFGHISLKATIASEETVSIRKTASIVPMIIASACANALYHGDPWGLIVLASVMTVLNVVIRQKQQVELRWLTEPVEEPPLRLFAAHGVIVVYSFMMLQQFFAPIIMSNTGNVRAAVGGAFWIAAGVVGFCTGYWLLRTGLRVLPEVRLRQVWVPLAASTGLMAAIGAGYVALLHLVPMARVPSREIFRLPASLAALEWDAALYLGMVVIAAPIFEEWIFRGLLYRGLRKDWNVATSVALSALLFTVVHPWLSLIGVASLGVVTALLTEKTGRLWPSMVVHFVYNAVVVAMWNASL